MAKRKRLAPPKAGFFASPVAAPILPDAPAEAARRAPPIADVAAHASTTAALEEMSDTLRRAREEGRMALELPLDQIVTDYLVRDRINVDEGEMEVLMTSLRQRGQQTPIEVAPLQDGRYGLISGWRRLRAITRLSEAGEAQPQILAFLRQPEQASDAYLAMVEENEIRVGLSYYERARIASRAVEQGVYPDTRTALRSLYHAASRAKRSKIGSFLTLVTHLDGVLRFPEALGERAGLFLAREIEAAPALAKGMKARIEANPPENPADELDLINATLAAAAGKAAAEKSKKQSLNPEIESNVTRKIRPDLQVVQHGAGGKLTVKGAAVDEALIVDLIDWLTARSDADEVAK
jgi:ParB/RepB/Spo0J family partition protein